MSVRRKIIIYYTSFDLGYFPPNCRRVLGQSSKPVLHVEYALAKKEVPLFFDLSQLSLDPGGNSLHPELRRVSERLPEPFYNCTLVQVGIKRVYTTYQ
jgi:hypothetical protein